MIYSRPDRGPTNCPRRIGGEVEELVELGGDHVGAVEHAIAGTAENIPRCCHPAHGVDRDADQRVGLPPLEQVSAMPSPTVTRAGYRCSPHGVRPLRRCTDRRARIGDFDGVKSDPPLESMRPTPQAVCVTLVVKFSAGTQKFGALNPPGKGTTVLCTQSGGWPLPTSWTMCRRSGTGTARICRRPTYRR